MNILISCTVGVNPGGIAVRPSCKTAVIALEGNPYVDATGNSVVRELITIQTRLIQCVYGFVIL